MALEGAGVPYFAEEEAEAFYELGARFEVFEEEEIAEGRDVTK